MLRSEDHPAPAGERRLAKAAQVHAPALWDYDFPTGEFRASPRFFGIYGFPPAMAVSLRDFIDATHPLDRAWTAALDGAADGAALLQGVPYRYRIHRRSDGATRWIRAHIETTRIGGGVAALTGFVEDVTEEALATAAATDSEDRLHLAVEAGQLAVWDVDVETGAISHSLELNRLCGFPAEARPSFADVRALYAPGERERLEREGATIEVIRSLAAAGAFDSTGQRRIVDWPSIQAEVSIITPQGEPKRLLLRAVIGPSPSGEPRVTGVLVDISERKRAEERLAVVARELQHRVKNVLALVQALAIQSFRGEQAASPAVAAFLGRVRALGAATDIVLSDNSVDVLFGDIVANTVAPHRQPDADPFVIAGPRLRLQAEVANALAMILHELCTNAAKYGSLRSPGGQVEIFWSGTPARGLRMSWRETGASGVTAPGRKGFGMRLIETLASSELKGAASMEFSPTGLVCTIVTGGNIAVLAGDAEPG